MKNDHLEVSRLRADLLDAIEPHVPFDGWSEPAFQSAISDLGVDPALARLACPRGAVDLAAEYHRAADRALAKALAEANFEGMRFRDKVATAVRMRFDLVDRDLVSRGASVFALPQNGVMGAKLVWETADLIWRALGDTSEDYNWYSKRLTLSGVISSTTLFWIGDDSEGHAESWAFLDHRIENVLALDKVKSGLMKVPGLKNVLENLRPPCRMAAPGRYTGEEPA
ncbi:ubiquinone biosynthesis protein COQ9 [Rhodobacter aestuarii]|uniref:Ubiquinone biosynthesis protein COQ9 n=1 Tax=Rhodobacter aestuarii TaxID=453582 RepID=A0A1N7N7Y2_9RHOB|nr:COQ9 family protein [Rhodobacter aestuarii]PTV96289.1 ubiquinone biosynthesis protein COQ9 [Rhodobacter aestuarii]SIS94450.1 ubiquinone biosynthesis protein COQ9 [Rhodobacter aestuarii]